MNAAKAFACMMILPSICSLLMNELATGTEIKNMNTEATVFYDDYEGLGSNVSHIKYPDTSGDYDPVAQIGTWDIYEGGDNSIPWGVQVTDSTAGEPPTADPGAYQGNNYLRFPEPYEGLAVSEGKFATQSTVGDVIHFETMLYMDYGIGQPGILFKNSAAGIVMDLRLNNNYSGKLFVHDGTELIETSIEITNMEWQKWEVDYAIGASTCDITVDGVTAPDLPVKSAGNLAAVTLLQWDSMHFIYLDACTEDVPAIPGDLNDNGFVGDDDLSIVRNFWGQTVTAGDKLQGDPSGDGFVGGNDLDLVRTHWGEGTPPSVVGVPEPGFIVMLSGSLFILLAVIGNRRWHI